MSENFITNENLKSFFSTYNGRYSQYWAYRWGMIPTLPTSFDNSNDIYELLSWLQRAFKQLLDDFAQLEIEFEEFKNAITEMLEVLIPELIREFINSKEFHDKIWNIIDEYYNDVIKPIIEKLTERVDKLESRVEKLEKSNESLQKIIDKLKDIGVWENDGFKDGMGIAGGNINHYGQDFNHFIKTTKNDNNESNTMSGVK